jgi:hypothetical protein
MLQPKKRIEVAMPVKEVSAESVRDTNIQRGPSASFDLHLNATRVLQAVACARHLSHALHRLSGQPVHGADRGLMAAMAEQFLTLKHLNLQNRSPFRLKNSRFRLLRWTLGKKNWRPSPLQLLW